MIGSTSATAGPASGGTSVTINGSALANTTAVTFGGTAGNITFRNATKVIVTTPAHSAGWVDIILTANNGTATVTNGFRYDAPSVVSVLRAGASPTNATAVVFRVMFDRAVTGVNKSDFALTTTASGASISTVTGSGSTYTVAVATGNVDGTVRLDVLDDDSIKDSSNSPLGGAGNGNGAFTGGETYTIDKTPPTISANRSPLANGAGWNNEPVIVSFTCNDASGIASCSGGKTFDTAGANQGVTGTATDNAGNTASTTVSGINIDFTKPLLTGAATTAPNAVGWYRNDVAIHWTCSDAPSGIVGCPADSIIAGEGNPLAADATVSDRAGNSTSASVGGIKLDRTPPHTTATAPSGWNNGDVTITLAATDNLAGVASTTYSLDGGAPQTGTSLPISAEGIHQIRFQSEDNAGNVEPEQLVEVRIDRTAPTISHSQAPLANTHGWNSSDVTVTFICGDALSGIASCTTPQAVTTEGASQTTTGTALDNAGNSATDQATVSIDKTAPTITVDPYAAANAEGWYNGNVTISFTCADALSGITACPASTTLGEGRNQSVSGGTTDTAGNFSSASVSGINIDTIPPTLDGAPTSDLAMGDWYNGDVTVTWSCGDAGSGISGACLANSTVSGEGVGLSASTSVSDRAGNSTDSTVGGINIDRTPPQTSVTFPSGWSNGDVNVSFNAVDALSQVATTFFSVFSADGGDTQNGNSALISGDGIYQITFWSVDNAGNRESPQVITVAIDTVNPTISSSQAPAANINGWNNTAVTVSFGCADTLSGVAGCTPEQEITTEGQDQPVTGWVYDQAGNHASTTALVNIDMTAPTITGEANGVANAQGWYNNPVTVNFTCGDELSGGENCADPATLNEGASQSVTGSATDRAGNTASTTVGGINVDLTAPTLSGTLQSIPNGAGWYRGDVRVAWSCGDVLSGIAGACPADSTISGEGDNLSDSASVSDNAGNSTSASVTGVKIDRTPPQTSADAPSGWGSASVQVTLGATDNLAGVAATYYQLDGGAPQSGNQLTISGDGIHQLVFWSVDTAGNSEEPQTIGVQIDQSAPAISAAQSPEANAAGWNNSDVTVTFTCDDNLASIASCTSPQTVIGEGNGQEVVGTAVDNAGNSASLTAIVNIDKTAPTMSGAHDRAANADGWYDAAVIVNFTCADALSGIANCPDAVTLGAGGNQSASGTATDAAGNSASATVSGINIDTTAPTLSGVPTTNPNAAGWYAGDVTIAWTCNDDLAGIATGACPANSVIDSEGIDLNVSASVSDRAGNSTSATVTGINIDRTPPSTTAVAPTGWSNTSVNVELSANDSLSGVAATYFSLDGGATQTGTSLIVSGDGIHTVGYWSVDLAGNSEALRTVEVKIDTTAPVASASVNGTSRAGCPTGCFVKGATVTLSSDDSTATMTYRVKPFNGSFGNWQTYSGPFTVNGEGKNLIEYTAADPAGNVAPVASINVLITSLRSTGVLDAFNRRDGSLGSPWTGDVGGYSIRSNAAQLFGGGSLYWRATTPFGVNQEAFVTLTKVDPAGGEQDLMLKVQGGTSPSWQKGVIEVLYDAHANSVRVETLRAGSSSWQVYANFPVTFQNGDQLGARALANGEVWIYRNCELIGKVTLNTADQTFFNSRTGQIGVWYISASQAQIDDFGGGSVTP